MPESALIVFDDSRGSFGPLTDLRAAFELRVGLTSALRRIERKLRKRASALYCAPANAALLASRHTALINALPAGERFEFVNGRSVGDCAVRRCNRAEATAFIESGFADERQEVDASLVQFPWDVHARLATTLAQDIDLFETSSPLSTCEPRVLRSDEGVCFGTHPILIDRTAKIGPSCVIDASNGAVIIGEEVVIAPLAVLVGPCAILKGSMISAHAHLKANTVIGPYCRVGGEVGACIFQGHSNKSHDGHLGDSFVGEWVNIGAGTTNSNLLNTYGEVIVRLERDGGLIRTNRQFWGSVIGDHAKLAIQTRIMTGTTIGTGAMIASSRPPSTLVERFAWTTDDAEAGRVFRVEKFLETAKAMMARRGHAVSAALEERLRALHAEATGP